MDPNLPPEILTLAKASPWAPVVWLVSRQICTLVSPIVSVLAVRLARGEKERSAFLELRRIESRKAFRLPVRKRDVGKGDE